MITFISEATRGVSDNSIKPLEGNGTQFLLATAAEEDGNRRYPDPSPVFRRGFIFWEMGMGWGGVADNVQTHFSGVRDVSKLPPQVSIQALRQPAWV